MPTTSDYRTITEWLGNCRRPLLFSHQRPDGDALGALVGMCLLVEQRGLRGDAWLFDPFPTRYQTLEAAASWLYWKDAEDPRLADYDALIVLDTCALAQLEPARDFLAHAPRTLVVDHHVTRDAIGNRSGDLRLIDETAGATCLLLVEWAAATGLRLTVPIARALFTGVSTDTGWFRYANTDARILTAASQLVAAGADVSELNALIYQQDPPEKIYLVGRMLSNMQLLCGGKLAVLTLRLDDFKATGADHNMTEDLVNETVRMAGAEATVMFTEQLDGGIRVNLRSKGVLDVAALAKRLGGGGHVRAAGARVSGPWNEVVRNVVAETTAALEAALRAS